MKDLRVRLFEFAALCCVAALLLAEGSVLQSGDQIVQCAETKVKVQGHCGASNASVCQAVENFTLTLTCSPCGDQDTVQWSFSNSSEEDFKPRPEQNKTLVIAAVNVTNEKTSGCYMCECGRSGLNFTVQVDLPGNPTFLVKTEEDGGPTHFDLHPATRRVPLNETTPGVVCINCSATGYPDLHYWWYYKDGSGNSYNASSDPCLSFYEDQPEVLCFTPTIHNVEQQRTYYCQVSNIVQTVTAQQYITYPDSAGQSEWFVRPHQLQSQGEIPLTGGRATAVCAAYPQPVLAANFKYYVCAPPNMAGADDLACHFNSLQCCSCHDNLCHLGIHVSSDTFYDSRGIPTDGCRVDSSVEGNFVCIVEKSISADGTTSVKQYIGGFSFVPVLALSLREIGFVCTIAVLVVIIVILICIVARAYKCCKRRTVKTQAQEDDEDAGDRKMLLAGANNGNGLSAIAVSHHCQSVSVITRGEGGKEIIFSKWDSGSDEELKLPRLMPGTKVILNVYSSDDRCVRIPVAEANCVAEVALFSPEQNFNTQLDRVRSIHHAFVKGVNIDPTVLSAMYGEHLVNKHQNGQINAMHLRKEAQDVIAAYFANCVLLNWPDDIFEQMIQSLVSVLKDSNDAANQSVAKKLSTAIRSEAPAGLPDDQ